MVFFPGILLFRKPSKHQGKRPVFEKNDPRTKFPLFLLQYLGKAHLRWDQHVGTMLLTAEGSVERLWLSRVPLGMKERKTTWSFSFYKDLFSRFFCCVCVSAFGFLVAFRLLVGLCGCWWLFWSASPVPLRQVFFIFMSMYVCMCVCNLCSLCMYVCMYALPPAAIYIICID